MSITLSSSDNQIFTIDKEIAEKSILLHNMLEDVGENDSAIPLPNVTGDILKKVRKKKIINFFIIFLIILK